MKWPDAISIKQIALALITGLLVLVSLVGEFAFIKPVLSHTAWDYITRTQPGPSWRPPSKGC